MPPFDNGNTPVVAAPEISNAPKAGPVVVLAKRGCPVTPAPVVLSSFVACAYFTPYCVSARLLPVPPFATATTPVTLVEVPVILILYARFCVTVYAAENPRK